MFQFEERFNLIEDLLVMFVGKYIMDQLEKISREENDKYVKFLNSVN